jgi:hypothetical protein
MEKTQIQCEQSKDEALNINKTEMLIENWLIKINKINFKQLKCW